MRRGLVSGLLLWTMLGTVSGAQAQSNVPSFLDRDVVARIVSNYNIAPDGPQDKNAEWLALRPYVGKQVVVDVQGGDSRTGRLVNVFDTELTLELRDQRDQSPLVIAQADVLAVRHRPGKGASVVGAVVGGAIGGVLGLRLAQTAFLSRCGGGCTTQTLLGAGALVGLPLAGAVFGYRLGDDGREYKTVYVKR